MAKKKSKAIILDDALDIMAAVSLKTALVDALEVSNIISLDGSKVERASTPCVQLLIAAANAAEKQSGSMQIAKPSPALEEAFADLGLSDILTKWSSEG